MSGADSGYIFHTETFGAVDGPGLRLVLFLQGCPLRCPYCHNPEGQALTGGEIITIDEVLGQLARYRSYYQNGGGITLSGGEPLVQSAFAAQLLTQCRAAGIHTALDTSGCIDTAQALAACAAADLLLLDVKTALPEQHAAVFGFPLARVEKLLQWCEEQKKPVWVRQVIVPGLTENEDNSQALAQQLRPYTMVQRVELLPLRKLCAVKYRARGEVFPMEQVPEPTAERMAQLRAGLAQLLPGIDVL